MPFPSPSEMAKNCAILDQQSSSLRDHPTKIEISIAELQVLVNAAYYGALRQAATYDALADDKEILGRVNEALDETKEVIGVKFETQPGRRDGMDVLSQLTTAMMQQDRFARLLLR